MYSLKTLIDALSILLKYENNDFPTNCTKGVLRVYLNIDFEKYTEADKRKLNEKGFYWDYDFKCWYSINFGSN